MLVKTINNSIQVTISTYYIDYHADIKECFFLGVFLSYFRQYSLNFDEAVIFVYQPNDLCSDYPDWIDKRIQ
jgi:hypothetical protein